MGEKIVLKQPIIRGIQAVGAVEIYYKYNGRYLVLPGSLMRIHDAQGTIDTGTGKGVQVAGFRLDSEFLRASAQIASSFMIPILGGGAVALTNNNRSGTLSLRTTKVSTPAWSEDSVTTETTPVTIDPDTGATTPIEGAESVLTTYTGVGAGAMLSVAGSGLGVLGNQKVYDLTFLLQAQQAQEGGDDVGATITVAYKFNGFCTTLEFQGCTVASIDPIGLAGNDAVDYNASINYLNWTANYTNESNTTVVS